MSESKTPRTDAHELSNGGTYGHDLARRLEIELNDALSDNCDLGKEISELNKDKLRINFLGINREELDAEMDKQDGGM